MPEENNGQVPNFKRKRNQLFLRWRVLRFCLSGGMFSLGILILVIHLTTWGASVYQDAGHWTPAQCVVKGLFVHSRPDFRGELLYRPEVLVELTVGDRSFLVQTFDGNALTNDRGFIHSRKGAEALLKNYHRDMTVPCWYRVDNPNQVVLVRQTDYWGWVFLVIPVTLILFGGGACLLMLLTRSRSVEQKAAGQSRTGTQYPTLPDKQLINESPGTELAFRLPVMFFPMFRFVTLALVAILWNTVSWSIFIYLLSVRSGWGDFLNALLFCLIFCGAGLLPLPWIFALFRRTLTIGTTILEISDHPVIPGRKHRLSLQQYGRLYVESLEIDIISEEVARYRQGTDTVTNTREVYRQSILVKNDIALPLGQSIKEDFFLQLPIGVMHSMESDHNEIKWTIVLTFTQNENSSCRRRCPVIVLPYTLRSEL